MGAFLMFCMKVDTSFSSLEINKHSQGFYPQDQKIERRYLAHRLTWDCSSVTFLGMVTEILSILPKVRST